MRRDTAPVVSPNHSIEPTEASGENLIRSVNRSQRFVTAGISAATPWESTSGVAWVELPSLVLLW